MWRIYRRVFRSDQMGIDFVDQTGLEFTQVPLCLSCVLGLKLCTPHRASSWSVTVFISVCSSCRTLGFIMAFQTSLNIL